MQTSVKSLLFRMGSIWSSVRALSASPPPPAAPSSFTLGNSAVLRVSMGDLTQWHGDAIVNAANERMLGGGDKGASGCLCLVDAAPAVAEMVETAYPRSRPDYADKYATHVVQACQGVAVFEGLL